MTEQEIIDVLKENKNEGRILSFMSEKIQKWCEEHKKELLVWQSERWYKFDADDICTDDAVTLPDDYKVKEKPSGEWVEFEIDKKGIFRHFMHGDMFYFFWGDWNAFLTEAYSFGYRAFGGWQYKDCDAWFLTPQIAMQGHFYNLCTKDDEPKPAVPTKIRFWRENK